MQGRLGLGTETALEPLGRGLQAGQCCGFAAASAFRGRTAARRRPASPGEPEVADPAPPNPLRRDCTWSLRSVDGLQRGHFSHVLVTAPILTHGRGQSSTGPGPRDTTAVQRHLEVWRVQRPCTRGGEIQVTSSRLSEIFLGVQVGGLSTSMLLFSRRWELHRPPEWKLLAVDRGSPSPSPPPAATLRRPLRLRNGTALSAPREGDHPAWPSVLGHFT